MEAQLYKGIKDCNASEVWPLVKDVVAIQLMGPGFIPIPFLEDAQYYQNGSLIVKESLSPLEKLKRIKPGIISIGNLKDFIDNDRKTGLANNPPKTRKVFYKINPKYTFMESDLKNKIRKTVTVEISGCERYLMENIPGEDALTIGMDSRGFQHVKKVYLVYEVCLADKIVVTCQINNQTDRVEVLDHVPVGFRMRRFRLKEDGALGESKDEPNKSSYNWIRRTKFRNPMDTLPATPNKKVN